MSGEGERGGFGRGRGRGDRGKSESSRFVSGSNRPSIAYFEYTISPIRLHNPLLLFLLLTLNTQVVDVDVAVAEDAAADAEIATRTSGLP